MAFPYLNGEYRTKKSVSVRNSDSSQDAVLAVNDNNIAVDPRFGFAVGRFGIPYEGLGIPREWLGTRCYEWRYLHAEKACI